MLQLADTEMNVLLIILVYINYIFYIHGVEGNVLSFYNGEMYVTISNLPSTLHYKLT